MNNKDKNINKNQQKGGYYLEGFVAFIVLIIITFLTGYLYEFDINNVTQMFYTKLEEETEANRIKQIKDSKNTEQSVSTNIEYKIPSRSQDPIATSSIIEKITTYEDLLILFNKYCIDKSLSSQKKKYLEDLWKKTREQFLKDSLLVEDFLFIDTDLAKKYKKLSESDEYKKLLESDKKIYKELENKNKLAIEKNKEILELANELKKKYTLTLESSATDRIKLLGKIKDIRNTLEELFCDNQNAITNPYAINLIADYLGIIKDESSKNALNKLSVSSKNDLLFSLLIESSKKVVKRESKDPPSESSSNKNDLLLSLLIESSKKVVKRESKDPPSKSSSNKNDLLLSLLIESSKNAVKSVSVSKGGPSSKSSSNNNDLLLSLLIESSKKVVKRESTKDDPPNESSSNNNDLLLSLLLIESSKITAIKASLLNYFRILEDIQSKKDITDADLKIDTTVKFKNFFNQKISPLVTKEYLKTHNLEEMMNEVDKEYYEGKSLQKLKEIDDSIEDAIEKLKNNNTSFIKKI